MKNYCILIKIVGISLLVANSHNLLSQNHFKKVLIVNDSEPNGVDQVIEHNGLLYFGGSYFDQSISRFTGYFAGIDSNGSIEFIGTEKMEIILGTNVSNNMLSDESGLYSLAALNNNILHYNFDADSIYVKSSFDSEINDFVGFGFNSHPDGGFLISGITNQVAQNIKVIYLHNNIVKSYSKINQNLRSGVSNPVIDKNKNILIVGTDFSDLDVENDSIYLLKLDKELNEVYCSKDSNIKSSFILGNGIIIDQSNNIVCTGQVKKIENGEICYSSSIIKIDSLGNEIWIKAIGSNASNFNGNGRWESIIESVEKDGYVLVGATISIDPNNPNALVTQATITKISYEGDLIWTYPYSFRNNISNVNEVFNDIVETTDGGYFLGGESIDNSDSNFTLPRRQSILLKVNSSGLLDTMVSTLENNIIYTKSNCRIQGNPVQTALSIIKTTHSPLKVVICTLDGNVIDKLEIDSTKKYSQINVSHLSAGAYLLHTIDNQGYKQVEKFIVR